MNYRIKLFSAFNIPVYLHWSFSLLIIYVIYEVYSSGYGLAAIWWSTLFMICIFACVTLHEYGHALAARRYGIHTSDITLLPIGGLARLNGMPEKPVQELIVAAAGPLVNVVIALLLFPIIYFLSDQGFGFQESDNPYGDNFMTLIFYMNIVLVLFNLIPAFPTDGGRMLRALLAIRLDRVKATRIAVIAGRVIAVLFIVNGLGFLPGNWPGSNSPFLALIGVFILSAGTSELNMVKLTDRTKGKLVKDFMELHPVFAYSNETVEQAIQTVTTHPGMDLFVLNRNQELISVIPRKLCLEGKLSDNPNALLEELDLPSYTKARVVDSIRDAYLFMKQNSVSSLPVFDGPRLVGVVNYLRLKKIVEGKA